MKKACGIGLFVCLLALGVMIWNVSDETGIPKENPVVITQGESVKKEDVFYLKELNGYLVVYKEDGTTVFEYTNILIEELPEVLLEDVKDGIKIIGNERLYGFLENYSS